MTVWLQSLRIELELERPEKRLRSDCGVWKAISIKAKLIANASDFNQMTKNNFSLSLYVFIRACGAERRLGNENGKYLRNIQKAKWKLIWYGRKNGNFLSFFAEKNEKQNLFYDFSIFLISRFMSKL